jgi:nucleotide-binding universal stress UspA family protein
MAIRTILVPLDGSELAERALPYASALVGAAGARMVLLRAVSIAPLPGFDDWHAQQAASEEARAALEHTAGGLRSSGLDVATLVEAGSLAWAIRHAAEDLPADLVVMSTNGHGGLGRWVYGSEVDEVLRLSPVPVFLVPAALRTGWVTAQRRRVLVPLDGSELAEAALGPAVRLTRALGAEMVLLRVVEPGRPDGVAWMGGLPVVVPADGEFERRSVEARDYLAGVATRAALGGLVAEKLVEVGDPADLAAATARREGVGLIVMATHGRTGLARLVMGSVASATLQRAGSPVVLVRPDALARPEADEAIAHGSPRAATPAFVAAPALALDPAEHEVVVHGLELLLAATDRGTPEAATIHGLLERLTRQGAAAA